MYLIKLGNKELNIFYERKESKVYLLTDRHYTNPLPPNVEIVETNFNEETINITELNSFFLNNLFLFFCFVVIFDEF